jgi:hypothetical protein
MARRKAPTGTDPDRPLLAEEIAAFLASCPTREQLLGYRPSPAVQQRARELLQKAEAGRITADEEWELNQLDFAETLMQLVKARLRPSKVTPS